MANLQISEDLFYNLLNYFYPDEEEMPMGYLADEIRRGLRDKLESIISRNLFSEYKRAATPGERELYRQAYLDSKGISASFRTSREIPENDL